MRLGWTSERLRRGLVVLATLSIAACQAPATPTPADDSDDQTAALADQLGNFEQDPSVASTFTDGVPALFTDGVPALYTIRAEGASGGDFRVQDAGSATYAGPYPAPAPSPDPNAPLRTSVGGYLNPRTITLPGGKVQVDTFYASGAYLVSITQASEAVQVSLTSAPTASTLPAAFTSQLTLPASSSTVETDQTFYVYARTGSGTAARWSVYDTSAGRHLFATVRASHLTTPATTLQQSEIASSFVSSANGPFATHHVTDSVDLGHGTHYSLDAHYDAATDMWLGSGSYQDLKTGFAATMQESWARTTFEKDETTRFETAKGIKVVLTRHFLADRSGTGSAFADGAKILSLAWNTHGVGTATLVRKGTTRPFRAF